MADDLDRDWMPGGPTPEEAKRLLEEHADEPEPAAADLPTDVRDGEAGQEEDDPA